MSKKIIIILCLLIVGCLSQPTQKEDKLTVVVTLYPYEEFAKEIGKEKIEVINLLKDGASPHGFELVPSQISQIENADIFLYNGFGIDVWAEKVKTTSSIKMSNTKGIKILENEDEHEREESLYDPHIWMDPSNVKIIVDKIESELSNKDPANKEYYKKNAQDYKQKLDELDTKIKKKVATFSTKEYVAFHPAYNYFNKRYGLEYAATIEEFAGDEPSAQEMAEIIEIAKEHNVKVIFSEPQLDPRIATAIAKEVNAEVSVLNPLESITSQERKEGKNYLTIMEENVNALEKALK